jgi:NAD-dependent deacetylase
MDSLLLEQAVEKIRGAKRVVAFTGAGISVESGVPPFRGENGIWANHDPSCLDVKNFNANPDEAWKEIRAIFYDHFLAARPNAAHLALAEMEKAGYLQGIITQNIDNLHQKAGSKNVVEFHGSSQRLVCQTCGEIRQADEVNWVKLPPRCEDCNMVLKPDFVFFGEAIPMQAHKQASAETLMADVWLVIGTTGEVMPAASLPVDAKRNGKTIIEVNVCPSNYTDTVTDIFLEGKASEVLKAIMKSL